MHIKDEKEF